MSIGRKVECLNVKLQKIIADCGLQDNGLEFRLDDQMVATCQLNFASPFSIDLIRENSSLVRPRMYDAFENLKRLCEVEMDKLLPEEVDRLTIKTQRCYDGESANSGITFDLSDLQEKGSGTST